MNNRLQQFLELEDLTPARLADILGVQRSGMSHILSGRNKPGFDFIHKLLIKFPNISADWFITGKGKPYKEMNRETNMTGFSPSKEGSRQEEPSAIDDFLKQDIFEKSEIGTGLFDSIGFDPQNAAVQNFSKNSTNEEYAVHNTDNESKQTSFGTKQLNENQINAFKRDAAFKKRGVKRVIIFYDDGSFEELFPIQAKGC